MRHLGLAAAAAIFVAAPAHAQDSEAALPDPNETSDYLNIGLGAAISPDYEGSNDYRIIPGGALRARTGGVSIFTRGTYLYADLVSGGPKLDFDLGPIAGVRLNRTGKVEDDAVDALGDRNVGVEVGGFAGVSFKGLTNPYDSLSFRLDAVKDVGKAHRSVVVTPTVDFGTPLSRTTFAGVSLSADFVSNKYADYYFGVTPAGSLASGLSTFDPDGGMKSWQAGLVLGQSLSGDLRKGWGLFGMANHKRLVGDFKRSPIVRDRGSAGQWFVAAGVGYSW